MKTDAPAPTGMTTADLAGTGDHRVLLADLVLRPDPTEVSRSRHVIGAVLRRKGYRRASDDTELVVSELVANAVEFARREVRVTVSGDDDHVFIEVYDDGDGTPTVIDAPPLADNGRGLSIVETLADEWGVAPDAEGGKTVWTELKR